MTKQSKVPHAAADKLALAEELRRAVGDFVRLVRDKAETEKSAQSETLGLLDREGAMNVAALAQRRGVTHQTMRVVVAQMETDGLIERTPDPADRRSHLVSLKDAGRQALTHGRNARAARIAAMFEETLTAAEQAHLHHTIGLLDRLCAAARG